MIILSSIFVFFFFSSRRRHTRFDCDWSSDVCSSDLLAVNMSKDVIERAIKKATGELEGVDYEEIRYEGYAPGGVAVIVDCLTDNRVRTVADVRHAFSKCGGNMGTEGSVAFMFKRLGVLSFAPGADEEAITEAAIEAGADD